MAVVVLSEPGTFFLFLGEMEFFSCREFSAERDVVSVDLQMIQRKRSVIHIQGPLRDPSPGSADTPETAEILLSFRQREPEITL